MIPIPFFDTDKLPLLLGPTKLPPPPSAPPALKPLGRDHLFIDAKGRMSYLPPAPPPPKEQPAPLPVQAGPIIEVTAENCPGLLFEGVPIRRSDEVSVDDRQWFSVSPPSTIRGWFNCSFSASRSDRALKYRYWNGEFWTRSAVTLRSDPGERAALIGTRYGGLHGPLLWSPVVPLWVNP